MNLYDKKPSLGLDTFVAPSASVIGAVTLGKRSSVWYSAVLRGIPNARAATDPQCKHEAMRAV